ncbi:MAG TPA: ATP-dependent Clp protease proteolytic subunit [Pseudonocardia sp.]|jgi:ATP-dependent Clp protease protease subunit|uniref:ATP-dependent Clp protease proteolytic subunit n=1 Tax=Pseudonocardia sp. TaxID=60912 RepID=UPI002B4B9232|nr:ATP-dependent Clp protease proteolytic subunit [Pseudonocardia sp.]HLU57355.1 ATP-dependent Clp protease proteolytic subunit [Pseudonocardia sp.]
MSAPTLDDAVYDRLLRERIVVLGTEVDDEVATKLVSQLLLLAGEDPAADITLYVNSPGGSVLAGMAIYDTMHTIEPDVVTVATGMAASMGQFLLTGGTPGKRFALPHAQVMMHQPHGGAGGSESDIVIRAGMMSRLKKRIAEITAERTGQPLERIEADFDRDRWFSAQEAVDYGLIDGVLRTAPR